VGRARRAASSLVRLAALALVLSPALVCAPARSVSAASPPATTGHVVIVGISGLTWDSVTPAEMPALWRLAAGGSVGSLVDYAQQPLACPADGWLTLNSAARAQGPRPCAPLPAVVAAGRGARVPAMPQIIRDNQPFHEAPAWGLLGSLAGCVTAAGPGAALALASPDGSVARYLPSAAGLSPAVLARCPLTVVDLGQLQPGQPERVRAAAIDRQLARLAAGLPAGTLLMVTAPGAALVSRGQAGPQAAWPPQLMTLVVHGPGYAGGLLSSASTRRPGIVALTDLTTTVASWLGQPVPAGPVGARITRAARGPLAPAVAALRGRDVAEQVRIATHGWFLAGYAVAALLAFGLPALLLRGRDAGRRRGRARCWRLAGLAASSVPLGSYLANLPAWWAHQHPALWLYGLTAGWTLLVSAAALAGPWRRDPLGPFGAVCAATLLLLAVDVMAGSRLQLDAPFGLSLLVSGRFYGIGNDALGVYCVSALTAAGWLAYRLQGRLPAPWPALAATATGLLAVTASGWPGFGAKAGGTIVLVPCFAVLVTWLAGVRIGPRWAVPVAVSGLALFLAFAVLSYLLLGTGGSDLATFAGQLLHGRGGDLLSRKVSANVGSLTLNVFGWLVPVAAAVAGVALWRPAALRLRTLDRARAAVPLLPALARISWLALVIGWLADDSGVIVPAVALPFAASLTVGLAASAWLSDCPPRASAQRR